MQSYKAVTVVIVALMLTGLAGFFMQTSTVEVDSEYYEIKGNLNPSVQYESIDDWTEYNPMMNITGWSGDAEIPTTTTANQYVIKPTILEYNSYNAGEPSVHFILDKDYNSGTLLQIKGQLNKAIKLSNSDYYITTQGINANYPQDMDGTTLTDIVIVDSNKVVNEDAYLMGGYSGYLHLTTFEGNLSLDTSNYINFNAKVGDNTYSGSRDLLIGLIPLSDYTFEGLTTNTVIHIPSGGVHSWTNQKNYLHTEYSERHGGTAHDGDRYRTGTVTTIVTYNLTPISYKDFIYDANTNQFFPAEKVNDVWEKVRGSTGLFTNQMVFFTTSNNPTIPSITYDIPELSPASYANAFDFVKIPTEKSGIWDNSELNGVVRILGTSNISISPYDYDNPSATPAVTITCPTNLPYKYYLMTLDFTNNSFTCKGVTSIAQTAQENDNPQAYTLADYNYDMTVVGTAPTSVEALKITNTDSATMTSFPAWKFKLDKPDANGNHKSIEFEYKATAESEYSTIGTESGPVTHTFYPTGGTLVYSSDYKTATFTTSSKTYSNLEVDSDGTIYIGYTLPVSSVYIDSTKIAVDPLGALWGNASMYLEYFFPDQFEQFEKVGKTGTRVLFNGFVKYGDSMTINGKQFPIVDGRLQYQKGVDSDGTIIYDYAPLKGMAIDYIKDINNNVNVSLVFTEYGNMTLSLGPLNESKIPVKNYSAETSLGYSILSTGTWYWQSSIYDVIVTHEDKVVFDALEGHYSLDMTASCLLMIFFIILITAVMQYLLKTEYTIVDWGITIASMALLLVMASTF